MTSSILLLVIGILVGGLGTLIGAGGGFILVPVLIFMYPGLQPEAITAVSMAIVACNALSGTIAYAGAKRIDYKAGIQFALFTMPGSILGVIITRYIPKQLFTILFGALLVILAIYLVRRKRASEEGARVVTEGKGLQERTLVDANGEVYHYAFNRWIGWGISLVVGFISPILGIGGGIIHVPALINWLRFPVHVATATSHFILAVMSIVSVIVHITEGSYHDPEVRHLVWWLGIGAVAGAQVGAFFSQKVKGQAIERALAISLGLVGIRIILSNFL